MKTLPLSINIGEEIVWGRNDEDMEVTLWMKNRAETTRGETTRGGNIFKGQNVQVPVELQSSIQGVMGPSPTTGTFSSPDSLHRHSVLIFPLFLTAFSQT